MKTIEISRESAAVNELLDQAQEEDVLVRSPDGKEYMLMAIDEFDEEIIRTRKNQKLMAFLDERAKQTKTVPMSEVKRRLGL